MESYLTQRKHSDTSQIQPETVLKYEAIITKLLSEITELMSKNLDQKSKIQAILQLIHSAVLETNNIKDLNNLYKLIMHDPKFSLLKASPTVFANNTVSTTSSSKVAGIFLHHCKNWFLKKMETQNLDTKKMLENVMMSSDPQPEQIDNFNIALELLNLLKQSIPKKNENRQLFNLLYLTFNELINDPKFVFAWVRFSHHEFKNFSLGLLLQNLGNFFDYHYTEDVVDPLRYFLLAVTFYKLNNPDVDISAEAKYSGFSQITRCIHYAESIENLKLLLDFLSQEGFNFLRKHKNPNLAKLQTTFSTSDKQTHTWQEILKAIQNRALELQPNMNREALDELAHTDQKLPLRKRM